jgi:uncharacterized delta-60 repeat protein
VVATPKRLGGATFEAEGIAADAAGRPLVIGKVGAEGSVGVLRLLSNGAPDPEFGALGQFIQPVSMPAAGGAGRDSVSAQRRIAVDPDGRVLLLTSIYRRECPVATEIRRLLPNGETDPSFGAAGILRLEGQGAISSTMPQWLGDEGAFEIAATSGGTVLCEIPRRGPESNALLRFDAAGRPDPSFGSDGIAVLGKGRPQAIAVDGQGRTTVLSLGSSLRRVDANGNLERSYGRDGNANLWRWGSGSLRGELVGLDLRQMAATSDGSVLVAGTRSQITTKGVRFDVEAALLRVDPNGHRADGFGARGLALAAPAQGGEAQGEALVLDDTGHALVAGALTSPRRPKVRRGVGLFAFALGR